MDISEILTLQRNLDAATHQKFKQNNSKETTTKKLIALLVEIGEFANEHGGFKYWKPQHKIDRNKMEEEYADVFHFLCSFAIMFDFPKNVDAKKISNDVNEQLLALFESAANLATDLNVKNILAAMELFLGMGSHVKMSEKNILFQYKRKNEINYARMRDGY